MIVISVAGASVATPEESRLAYEVGREVARRGAALLTGGLGGVMEAASDGAKSAGGLVIGILPGVERGEANPHVDVAIPTGLGDARNVCIAFGGDALIAVGGGLGTLSEVALALKRGRPVVLLRSVAFELKVIPPAPLLSDNAKDAVRLAFEAIEDRPAKRKRAR